jgi:uncharacterized membrane protein YhaH (DUF805 family)
VHFTNSLPKSLRVHSSGTPSWSLCGGVASLLPLALSLALLLAIIFSLFPSDVSASSMTPSSAPSLQVNAGFGAYFRNGAWVPLYITLRNNGSDFSGTLTTGNPPSPIWQGTLTMIPATTYQQPITVPRGTQKQVVLYLPITSQSGSISIPVQLLDSQGKVVQSQSVSLNQLYSDNVFVGLLSEQASGFEALRNVVLPNQNGSVKVQFLDAQTMPAISTVLANFNVVVLDAFNTGSLTREQLRALQLWVQQGGTLIEIGGTHWQQTLGTLPADLLPVSVRGTSVLAAGTHLLPGGVPTTASSGIPTSDTLQAPIIASTATLLAGARTILSAGAVPILVQAESGQGLIYYLAYDPALEPIVDWPGATALWRGLIIRSLGEQLLTASFSSGLSPGIPYYLAKLQHLLLTNSTPVPWLLLVFFFGYLAILWPVRWLIIRRTKQRQWSWRIILSAILFFSLLSYAVAFYQERASIFSNSLSIIQLDQGGSSAHSTTYLGVYVPFESAESDVQVHLPGGMLVQSFLDSVQQHEQVTVAATPDGTQLKASTSEIRLLDAFQAEQDISKQGGIISHLVLALGAISGTVTNTLPTALSDVYLLMPRSIVRIGDLAPGQTSRVTLSLAVPSTNGGLPPCNTLVKQVAANDPGMLTGYDRIFISGVPQSLNARQRHLNLLAFLLTALQCGNPALEAAGSSATLIGWATQPLDGVNTVTVNGIHTGGIHDTLLLADLAITYPAGSLILPPDVLPGRLVDAQALGARLLSPDSYAMSHGQITFEYGVPSPEHLRIQTIRFSEPADTSISAYKQPGGSNGSASHVALYNWQTSAWDIIRLTQSASFTTQNAKAYLSPDGQILVQYVNQASDFSDIAFTKPSLTVTGMAAQS